MKDANTPSQPAAETLVPTETKTWFGVPFVVARPHRFGLVIEGVGDDADLEPDARADYLHAVLLNPTNRDAFLQLIETERLVVCKNVRSDAPSYRPVKGKSSAGRLSPAEYYHHDGSAGPGKPRIDEIRLPHQGTARRVATAVAPFGDVVRAQLDALPERFISDAAIAADRAAFARDENDWPAVDTWERTQGRVTRLVRKEMDAESARAYFREVDRLAGAFDLPWAMGESRLMLNDHTDLRRTVQHRRAYQAPRAANEPNGSLVKRWTAEEL